MLNAVRLKPFAGLAAFFCRAGSEAMIDRQADHPATKWAVPIDSRGA